MGYWAKIAHRAWQDTKPWLGLAPPRESVRRLGAAVALALGVGIALIAADRVARANWIWAFVLAFAALVLVLLLWNFLRAPDRMHREAEALISALSERMERRGTTEDEANALQDAYAAGRELLRLKSTLTAEEMKPRADEWFSATAELVKRVGSRNDAFSFATAADFAAVPGGDQAPAGILLTRLAKLKHIIDRIVEQQEGGLKMPGLRRAADED